jgi:HNH endonuclease
VNVATIGPISQNSDWSCRRERFVTSMRIDSLRRHLRPYKIAQRRTTTIAHAFASAIAPVDEFTDEIRTKAEEAMRTLGQNPDNLSCVYCDRPATDWDHVQGLVKKGKPSGFGHVLENLVPCCSDCNAKKGNRDWESFLESKKPTIGEARFMYKKEKLTTYLQPTDSATRFMERLRLECAEEIRDYYAIRDQIIELMREADQIAQRMQNKMR